MTHVFGSFHDNRRQVYSKSDMREGGGGKEEERKALSVQYGGCLPQVIHTFQWALSMVRQPNIASSLDLHTHTWDPSRVNTYKERDA